MSVAIAPGTDDRPRSNSKNRSTGRTGGYALDPESVRLHMASLAARLSSRVSIDTLRPLSLFLGLPSSSSDLRFAAGAFTPPVQKIDKTTVEKIINRFQLNFAYFLSNYAFLAALVAVVVALMHPTMIIALGIVYALWLGHSYLIKHSVVLFGGNVQLNSILSVQQRFYLLLVITIVVVIWRCLVPTVIFFSIAGLLIISHALMRDPKHLEQQSSLTTHSNSGRVTTLGSGDNDSDEDSGYTSAVGEHAGIGEFKTPRNDV